MDKSLILQTRAMSKTYAIGVDVGGTKVAAGLVDSTGAIVCQTKAPMVVTKTAADGLACVQQAIEAVLRGKEDVRDRIAGIGIGTPGPLDPRRGIVIHPRNLPCWRDFPLTEEIARAFGIPARLDNDANAAALGEALWGAGAGYRNVFCFTVGTGIGTGIVMDRRIYHGRTGNAAEGGHVSIDYRGPQCNCGKRGCIEAYCAGPAIARRARERIAEGCASSSRIAALVNNKLDAIQTETVAEAYRQGDALATALFEETADLLAVWLGTVIDLIEPDVIIMGGGVAEILSSFRGRISQRLPQWTINPHSPEIPLLMAKYGAEAGIVGTAALILAASEEGL